MSALAPHSACPGCGRAMYLRSEALPPGGARYGARGKCATCYQRDDRAGLHDGDKAPRRTLRQGPRPGMSWQEQAECQTVDVEVFFPPDRGASRWSPELAKAICGDCPVRMECLEHAVTTDEPHGVWGGLTADERRALARGGAA